MGKIVSTKSLNVPFSKGVVHKLRLQDEVGRWSKNVSLFVNVHTIENVNLGG